MDVLLAVMKKHLHVRGEDVTVNTQNELLLETPPRTWRRQPREERSSAMNRNTSTYVEKTFSPFRYSKREQKHLHVRGEDQHLTDRSLPRWETPPRTWRRHLITSTTTTNSRNTSTYVEKTDVSQWRGFALRKHLHVRGEDISMLPHS